MTRYAVGDLQGCLKPLQCLLQRVNFDPQQDQLWLVGDLINRGPDSLATLRFLKNLGPCTRIVLGNHDLHFLAVAYGTTTPRPHDTLDELLQAPDKDELVAWLIQQPLMYRDPSGDYCMSHAGISPLWTISQAESYAREVEQILQSSKAVDFFNNMYGNKPAGWQDDLQGWPRYRTITNYFTRMRYCGPQGELDLNNKSSTAPANFHPWFTHPLRSTQQQKIIFGHWAALQGKANTENIFALDTGCAWKGHLSLMNLETQAIETCDCGDSR
ncbi:symmetrical bis(5'-nucleosyl)-tetraphosphatase [Dasania sp. GY-MA-18]|uniref:Bis(5'-nucleosyl)-tetraphosphatase, symmetrical n=1 Tax=Dasania phycosphaerae TaxID=2950436 RepID=A0A9J6RK15_9GAMM|nr:MULTISPECIES: symmetrical bis(5'-nucleosyl)-tetraphosphatase [Dasania]MCR8922318.1 symmetrical bis(5'-nucleosyl)-tetraphosphatase [Dasania sp. GY-MA-18]MCZ0864746.1 symmetrical bis(5'-nucleosyl)-tetraphosphatase [Dasania phycosphaerae]MCZ0868474.1 symmetrical bis(5'-nucleosyl)-tetraphosphatase [Dasania phycosphaerae]